MNSPMSKRLLRPSRRAASAAEAVVERILGTYLRPGVANLAPGLPHWSPPATLQADAVAGDHSYGDCHGEAALLDSLRSKLEHESATLMDQRVREVMVTPGANQAFGHALLAVCDPGDEVVLMRPYYFSHLVR